MTMLKAGDQAPNFVLPASNGKFVSLADYRQKKNVVLYFYPKDDTPGCTTEACGFRDSITAIEDQDTIVLGVSPDAMASHDKFIQKFKLVFLLLSDEQKEVCAKYDVLAEKNMYGKKYIGVARTTFVIDKSGKILRVFEKVNPEGHEIEVLECLKGLKQGRK